MAEELTLEQLKENYENRVKQIESGRAYIREILNNKKDYIDAEIFKDIPSEMKSKITALCEFFAQEFTPEITEPKTLEDYQKINTAAEAYVGERTRTIVAFATNPPQEFKERALTDTENDFYNYFTGVFAGLKQAYEAKTERTEEREQVDESKKSLPEDKLGSSKRVGQNLKVANDELSYSITQQIDLSKLGKKDNQKYTVYNKQKDKESGEISLANVKNAEFGAEFVKSADGKVFMDIDKALLEQLKANNPDLKLPASISENDSSMRFEIDKIKLSSNLQIEDVQLRGASKDFAIMFSALGCQIKDDKGALAKAPSESTYSIGVSEEFLNECFKEKSSAFEMDKTDPAYSATLVSISQLERHRERVKKGDEKGKDDVVVKLPKGSKNPSVELHSIKLQTISESGKPVTQYLNLRKENGKVYAYLHITNESTKGKTIPKYFEIYNANFVAKNPSVKDINGLKMSGLHLGIMDKGKNVTDINLDLSLEQNKNALSVLKGLLPNEFAKSDEIATKDGAIPYKKNLDVNGEKLPITVYQRDPNAKAISMPLDEVALLSRTPVKEKKQEEEVEEKPHTGEGFDLTPKKPRNPDDEPHTDRDEETPPPGGDDDDGDDHEVPPGGDDHIPPDKDHDAEEPHPDKDGDNKNPDPDAKPEGDNKGDEKDKPKEEKKPAEKKKNSIRKFMDFAKSKSIFGLSMVGVAVAFSVLGGILGLTPLLWVGFVLGATFFAGGVFGAIDDAIKEIKVGREAKQKAREEYMKEKADLEKQAELAKLKAKDKNNNKDNDKDNPGDDDREENPDEEMENEEDEALQVKTLKNNKSLTPEEKCEIAEKKIKNLEKQTEREQKELDEIKKEKKYEELENLQNVKNPTKSQKDRIKELKKDPHLKPTLEKETALKNEIKTLGDQRREWNKYLDKEKVKTMTSAEKEEYYKNRIDGFEEYHLDETDPKNKDKEKNALRKERDTYQKELEKAQRAQGKKVAKSKGKGSPDHSL